MTDIAVLRLEVERVADAIQHVINEHRGNLAQAAITAKVDLGHVVRELRRADTFLTRAQKALQPDRWAEDMEAGAIG